MQNPALKDSLPQILNRSEWRRYHCPEGVRYAITYHQEPTPAGCQLMDSLGAGPRLLPDLTAAKEAFVSFHQGQLEKDALGIHRPNARSGIAITARGDLIWIVVEQKPRADKSGLSLVELAQFLRKMGAVSALNLDGGSSAAFYYQGNVVYGKVDHQGKKVERTVKSVLWLEKI